MTQHSDTLVCDTLRIAHWQATPGYDYNHELLIPKPDLISLILKWIYNVLRAVFGNRVVDQYGEHILVSIFIMAVLLLGWFIYKKRPGLFARTRKAPLRYSVYEDTIYNVDFDTAISQALAQQDYREAIRLLYLHTLKQLNDREIIDWQPHKTPSEYIYEVKKAELKVPLRKLTQEFLRIRYGNFEATAPLFEEMTGWQQEIQKGGTE